MGKRLIIDGHSVKTEKAEPPISSMLTPTVFYATLEGNDEIVGNGSSRHAAIEHLRKQLDGENDD